jgi:cellulose synthase/poly-beta-1,6-N-acetylglucosamine synthase-like glycosyltransferase
LKEDDEYMLEKVSVLLPIGGNLGPREEAFNWVVKFYETLMPEVELCIGRLDETPFSKSKAVNLAAKKATRDIFVIADTDFIYDPKIIEESIPYLENYALIHPFSKRTNLTKESTEELLKTTPAWPIQGNYDSWEKVFGKGGVNIIRREHFEQVDGFDERFKGWGAEDDSFVLSVRFLCGGAKGLQNKAIHLWHPRGDMSNYANNKKLWQQYLKGKDAILAELEKRRNI